MTDDRMAGTAKNLGGQMQEGFGRATGDLGHEVKGKVRQVEGSAQDLYGQAKDALADAARMAQDGAVEARDVVREIIEERPYTVAIAALAVGFMIGRMGRHD
ncbi:MAG: CsbD family protein [Xanthobacteraceae bacterium]|nr:CsbD family protein [Xanthobacteraceae bacterium]